MYHWCKGLVSNDKGNTTLVRHMPFPLYVHVSLQNVFVKPKPETWNT